MAPYDFEICTILAHVFLHSNCFCVVVVFWVKNSLKLGY